jgi:signal transduction histidine kinase
MGIDRFLSHSQAERIIAVGRISLAPFALLASRLDPSEPAKYARTTSLLLSSYLGYAVVLFALFWILRRLPAWWPASTHVFDLGVFLILMYFTEGPDSPFFVYFTFSLVCATLRWQWRGALWTATIAISAFLLLGVYASRILRDPGFDLNRFIARGSYLVVVAGLLGYLGVHQERLSAEKSQLAAWPRNEAAELRALVAELLDRSAKILDAPRMLMIWEVPGEPLMRVARRSEGRFELTDEPLAAFGSLVAKPLAGTSFLCADAGSGNVSVTVNSPGGTRLWETAPLDPALRARFGIGAVLSWSLRGQAIEGRLFALDKTGMTPDDLVLGEIVAGLAVARMDQFALQEQLRVAAATEERIRLSRDLHDGLLQSLTGLALQLQVSRRLLESEPNAARELLSEIQASIASEQRDLRAFVLRLKPAPPAGREGWSLRLRLEEMCNRIERQWGLRVKLSSEDLACEQPAEISDNVLRIVHEALVNAGRHAEASCLQVNVARDADAMRITVDDNGHGFSFRGTYDLATLQRMKAGPITLKERISWLGGDLVISSSEAGARLDIRLPLPGTEG